MAKKVRMKRVHYPPGSLVYKGKEQFQKATARIIRFSTTDFFEEIYSGDKTIFKRNENVITWIHVNGIHDVNLIAMIGNAFQLHPLLLEDILGTETIPKQEDFGNSLFASLNAITFSEEDHLLLVSNVSLVLREDVILSFQEAGPDFNAVLYERLANNQGQLRSRKADYLFYRFIDIIVDEYKDIIDSVENRTEDLEDQSVREPDNSYVAEIQQLRQQLSRMRRNVTPVQKLVNGLYLEPGNYIQENSMHFLRDLIDDIEHVHQRIEGVRENLLSIMDINYANLSNRTNEVMRLLTIVATIFIPLTFVAGIYGMNFHHMPELAWKYSYPIFWIIIVGMVAGMLIYFRKRKWL